MINEKGETEVIEEHRIQQLEREVQGARAANERVEKKIDSIADALRILVRIEERQVAANTRLAALEDGQQETQQRLRQLEVAMPENIDKRLVSIETKLPGLVEARRWVVMGVLSGIGMIGLAVVHLVLK